MIDSGSTYTHISKKLAEERQLFILPKVGSIPLANNQKAKIVGEVVISLEIGGHTHNSVVANVIEDLFIELIVGKDILKKHKKVTMQFDGPGDELVIGAMPEGESFPCMNVDPPPLFTNLSKDIKPVATKSRRHTPVDLEFMRKEVAKLAKSGVIRKSVSPWRAQAMVVSDENHKRRMVIDYSETINLYTELDAYPMPDLSKMVQDLSKYKYFATFDLKSAYHQVPIREEDVIYTAFEVDGELWEFTRVPFGITNGVSGFQRTIDKAVKDEKLEDTFAYLDNVTVGADTWDELERNVAEFHRMRKKYNIHLNNSKTVYGVTSLTVLGYTISHNKISPDYTRLKPLLEMPPPINLKSQKRVVGMFSYYSKFIRNFSDKMMNLNRNRTFPLPPDALESFQSLKNDLKDAALHSIDYNEAFTVETDASDFCIAASLSQKGRPVAFFSRTLNSHEVKHHPVEKEAAAIVESIRAWRHFLLGRNFTVITDQKSVGYMYDRKRRSKIKNDKIARWRVELSQYQYIVKYRPGKDNVVADTFSRIAAMNHPLHQLREMHENLCHPGITRLSHFVRAKNLPYSQEDVKKVTSSCHSCLFLKPKFLKSHGTLIKAIAPFQRMSIDFKGPLPASKSGNRYLLTIIDEYSRFPFAYACRDTSSRTVTHCLSTLFALFGMPDMIHNDRATDFLSDETKQFLTSKGVATSKTSRYNPRGNGQVERLNGTLWKAIQVSLHSRKLKLSDWESVLPDALHSVRSLLCTATNQSPHERLFNYERRSTSGKTMPSWVKPGPVYIRNHVKQNKMSPPVSSATLINANPEYAHVRLDSGVETTVSLRDLAPSPSAVQVEEDVETTVNSDSHSDPLPILQELPDNPVTEVSAPEDRSTGPPSPLAEVSVTPVPPNSSTCPPSPPSPSVPAVPTGVPPVRTSSDNIGDLRRSSRRTQAPKWHGDYRM